MKRSEPWRCKWWGDCQIISQTTARLTRGHVATAASWIWWKSCPECRQWSKNKYSNLSFCFIKQKRPRLHEICVIFLSQPKFLSFVKGWRWRGEGGSINNGLHNTDNILSSEHNSHVRQKLRCSYKEKAYKEISIGMAASGYRYYRWT